MGANIVGVDTTLVRDTWVLSASEEVILVCSRLTYTLLKPLCPLLTTASLEVFKSPTVAQGLGLCKFFVCARRDSKVSDLELKYLFHSTFLFNLQFLYYKFMEVT